MCFISRAGLKSMLLLETSRAFRMFCIVGHRYQQNSALVNVFSPPVFHGKIRGEEMDCVSLQPTEGTNAQEYFLPNYI